MYVPMPAAMCRKVVISLKALFRVPATLRAGCADLPSILCTMGVRLSWNRPSHTYVREDSKNQIKKTKYKCIGSFFVKKFLPHTSATYERYPGRAAVGTVPCRVCYSAQSAIERTFRCLWASSRTALRSCGGCWGMTP